MQRYATRSGLMGLAFLLAASLSTASRAGDAELFADLIPGTALSYEELGDIYGRGLESIGEGTIEHFNGIAAGEFFRERLRELFERVGGVIDSRSASGIVNTTANAIDSQARVKARAQATANRALSNALAIRQRNQDAIRDRIAAIRGR